MAPNRHIIRDISYAPSAQSRSGRALIRLMENATGRRRVIKRAQGYERDVAAGRDFWSVMMDRYGISLDITSGTLENIPQTGPLILIANHPYGILDGLILGHILAQRRGDFKILANSVFRKTQDLDRVVLPISFEDTKAALRQNIQTRKTCLSHLDQGGAIGVFPGGTVSTGARLFSQPLDPQWRRFTARMVAKSQACVVPIYFQGRTSRLFQIASHVHPNLRLGLLIQEFRKRTDTPVRVAIGTPLTRAQLDPLAQSPTQMMQFLRKETYGLAPDIANPLALGYEFEKARQI
ncbi:MAG: lysophospholipid acyltransferase family protein [Paracoccaceae bacterium]